MADQPKEPETDLFGNPVAPLAATVRRTLDAAGEIMREPPDRADFLHAVLCQVGMPRSKTDEREFTRESGLVSIRLEAGSLYDGRHFVRQPLPYGSRPRLVMVHISSEAVRTQRREIEIGDSIRDFLGRLGIPNSGGARGGYGMFKRQMQALAACRMTLGMATAGRAITINTNPITRFEAWLHAEGEQRTLWPGELQLSQEFYETLVEHAVPLDPRALGALSDSALALDIYSWLAHRLWRVNKREGSKLSWRNLREQFGQEYADPKDFKKKFRIALQRVLVVYPDARVENEAGGLLLKPSRPPVPKSQILLPPR